MKGVHMLVKLSALIMALGLQSAWSQTMQVLKATELRQEASADGAVLRQLEAGSQVLRLQGRQGAYVQIKTAQDQTGWVRMFDIGATENAPPNAAGNAATDALRGLTSLFGAGAKKPAGGATATLGIRGLGAEEIANAQPNPAELTRAQGYRASDQNARAFAAQLGLRTRQVAELPVPPPPAGSAQSP